MSAYEVVIGLEVHAQLKTQTKLFCRCANLFGAPPNTLTCPVCLGMPGALPVLNRHAVELAIRAGLSLSCTLHEVSVFARKNYFYPDLPKGYQISQFDKPLCTEGHLSIDDNGTERVIGIERIHMEEDAGKLLHGDNLITQEGSLVDLNRAGVPLIEIVGRPDLRSPEQAVLYLKKLHQIVRFAGVSDGNMEEGSFRCDANVSIRPKGQKEFGTKVEIKNMNSFRHVQKAIEYEIARQEDVLHSGGHIQQETRLWNPDKQVTTSMRSKENAHDYRYFPDPDLKPLHVAPSWIEEIRKALPELPDVRAQRFETAYGLPAYDAGVLTSDKALADFFEAVLTGLETPPSIERAKQVSNFVMSEVMRVMKERSESLEALRFKAPDVVELLSLIQKGVISGKIAKELLDDMAQTGTSPSALVEQKGLTQISDTGALQEIVARVVAQNAKQAADYKAGKDKLFGFFVGQVMKETQGKANPGLVNTLLKEELAK